MKWKTACQKDGMNNRQTWTPPTVWCSNGNPNLYQYREETCNATTVWLLCNMPTKAKEKNKQRYTKTWYAISLGSWEITAGHALYRKKNRKNWSKMEAIQKSFAGNELCLHKDVQHAHLEQYIWVQLGIRLQIHQRFQQRIRANSRSMFPSDLP